MTASAADSRKSCSRGDSARARFCTLSRRARSVIVFDRYTLVSMTMPSTDVASPRTIGTYSAGSGFSPSRLSFTCSDTMRAQRILKASSRATVLASALGAKMVHMMESPKLSFRSRDRASGERSIEKSFSGSSSPWSSPSNSNTSSSSSSLAAGPAAPAASQPPTVGPAVAGGGTRFAATGGGLFFFVAMGGGALPFLAATGGGAFFGDPMPPLSARKSNSPGSIPVSVRMASRARRSFSASLAAFRALRRAARSSFVSRSSLPSLSVVAAIMRPNSAAMSRSIAGGDGITTAAAAAAATAAAGAATVSSPFATARGTVSSASAAVTTSTSTSSANGFVGLGAAMAVSSAALDVISLSSSPSNGFAPASLADIEMFSALRALAGLDFGRIGAGGTSGSKSLRVPPSRSHDSSDT
mmetsp:Transcript_3931/g.9882  ORF Transcript_3931/g.9882 Transcript_3931/m.9882 type:complete len:414 (+) Transcript_3931:221-1462(+)